MGDRADPPGARAAPGDETNRIVATRALELAQDFFGLRPADLERSTAAQVLVTAAGLIAGALAKPSGSPSEVIDEVCDIAEAVVSGEMPCIGAEPEDDGAAS
jgi:hypothetical protein